MGNYKPLPRSTITVGGLSRSYPDDSEIVSLYFLFNTAGAPKSLFDGSATAYQVPTGFTLNIIGVRVEHNALVAGNFKLYTAAFVDATTTLLRTVNHAAFVGWSDYLIQVQVLTEQYVTIDPQANIFWIELYGYLVKD